MSKKLKKDLKVAVKFDPSRIQAAHLIMAYEAALPPIKRMIKASKLELCQENTSLHYKEPIL